MSLCSPAAACMQLLALGRLVTLLPVCCCSAGGPKPKPRQLPTREAIQRDKALARLGLYAAEELPKPVLLEVVQVRPCCGTLSGQSATALAKLHGCQRGDGRVCCQLQQPGGRLQSGAKPSSSSGSS